MDVSLSFGESVFTQQQQQLTCIVFVFVIGHTAMAAAAAVAAIRAKRAHNDDNMVDKDGDGFQFPSHYTKRLRREKLNQETRSSSGLPGEQSQRRRQQQQSPPKPRNQRQHDSIMQQSGKSRSQVYDEAIDTVVTQFSNVENDDAESLRSIIVKLQEQVNTLTEKLDFIMSFVGADLSHVDLSIKASDNGGTGSYAAVLTRNIPNVKGPIRDALLTAVHSDLQLKQSRICNVVITGLPKNPDQSDEELVVELCLAEFGINPDVTHIKRLGREVEDRTQPLLIVLQTEAQAKLLLSHAKTLRQSEDDYTAAHVYLSPHQTRAERQAAYEARCKRRQQVATRSQQLLKRDPASQRAASSDAGQDGRPDVEPKGRRPSGQPATDENRRLKPTGLDHGSAESALMSSRPAAAVAGADSSDNEELAHLLDIDPATLAQFLAANRCSGTAIKSSVSVSSDAIGQQVSHLRPNVAPFVSTVAAPRLPVSASAEDQPHM